MKKKLFDEEGRLFGRISVIDILLVILVAVLVFAAFGRREKVDEAVVSEVGEPFEYQIKVRGLRDVSADSFREGDALFEFDTDTPIGVIEKIEKTSSLSEVTMPDGSVPVIEIEDRYDVVLTVRTQGFITSGRYFADGIYELSTNAPRAFYSKYNTCNGTVWSLLGEVKA